mmetsp:Transcript_41694/g.124683  ORF Transcript_41694/g.124683 Transcript_41694/m.124683 type:complete len:84 (-) Transcript_41694:280-531(-)
MYDAWARGVAALMRALTPAVAPHAPCIHAPCTHVHGCHARTVARPAAALQLPASTSSGGGAAAAGGETAQRGAPLGGCIAADV